MADTKIEWAEKVWNPVTGCSKISPGCRNCYAERMSKRLAGRFGYPADDPFKVTLHPDKLNEPLNWEKPKLVFTCSMGDLFHPDVEPAQIAAVFEVIKRCSQHIFMVLTKRPHVMLEHMKNSMLLPYFGLENLWLGVSVEDQEHADKRIPYLLEVPAAVHFVSIEPMLGPIDLTYIDLGDKKTRGYGYRRIIWDVLSGLEYQYKPGKKPEPMPEKFPFVTINNKKFKLDWVIAGGESGPGARPCHPDWARKLRDQCVDSKVPFLFKQWGEFTPVKDSETEKCDYVIYKDGTFSPLNSTHDYENPALAIKHTGKKHAGRLLDGTVWDETPLTQLNRRFGVF